jgi:hypothetical protein
MNELLKGARFLGLVLAVAVLTLTAPAAAQSPAGGGQITATCSVTDEFPLPTSGDAIPVVVTYMKNSRRPADDVQTKLPKARLRSGFESGGEFNSVWGPKGIKLVLVGLRTCLYRLGPEFEKNPPRADAPKPDASFEPVFLTLLRNHNTRTVRSGSQRVEFRGLDLYVWWEIAGFPGFGVRPRFGRQNEELERGNDEPARGRPGAIWMSKACVEQNSCPGVFAHEVGHFFGLCHCCHSETETPRCLNALRLEYCPGLGARMPQRVSCTADLKNRLMNEFNAHNDEDRRELKECEVDTARDGARKVRKFGSNGLTNTGGNACHGCDGKVDGRSEIRDDSRNTGPQDGGRRGQGQRARQGAQG